MERVAKASAGNYFTRPKHNIEWISTGCTTLDLALGGGGWAEDRIFNVVGDKSTGKTLQMIEAAANFHRKHRKGKVLYREVESAWDDEYAEAVGMPMSAVDKGDKQLDTIEDMFEELEALVKVKRKYPILYAVDSLDALTDRAEKARGIDEGTYGMAKAKYMSQMFRRLVRALQDNHVTVGIVSQVRDDIAAAGYGRGVKRSGGRALDFYASQVVYLSNKGKIYKTIRGLKRAIGINVRAQVDKNKVGLPYRESEYSIEFGYGIDDGLASLSFLNEIKALKLVGYDSGVMAQKHLRTEAAKLTPAELDSLNDIVRKEWYKLEREFVPTRKKYSGPHYD